MLHQPYNRWHKEIRPISWLLTSCFSFCRSYPKEYPDQYVHDMVIDVSVEIIKLQKVTHDATIMSSYKLTAWKDDVEKLLQPDAWPEFITCRHFHSHHCDNRVLVNLRGPGSFRISCQVTVLDIEILLVTMDEISIATHNG